MTIPEAPEQITPRTVRGICWWLGVGVGIFWLSVLAIVTGALQALNKWGSAPPGTPIVIGGVGLLVGVVVTMLAYLFILLEPGALAERRIKIWLTVSFVDFIALSLLFQRLLLYNAAGRIEPVIRLLVLLIGVGLFVMLLRTNRRLLLPLAFLLLLASNLHLR